MAQLHRLIEDDRIIIDARPTAPDPAKTDWPHTNYAVTLHRPGQHMDIEGGVAFGLGNPEGPTAENVLTMLLAQAFAYEEAGDYREWATGYGDDPDEYPVHTRDDYNRVGRQTDALRDFLGDKYDTYLHAT